MALSLNILLYIFYIYVQGIERLVLGPVIWQTMTSTMTMVEQLFR